MKTIEVPLAIMVELMTRESKLNMLEAGGVNSWDWYDAAMGDWSHDYWAHYFEQNLLSFKDKPDSPYRFYDR